jgi:hypothetical protein
MSAEVGKRQGGPDILAKAKAAMNMGANRLYDPRFDSNAFVPSNVVEVVLTQVGMGKHPGVEVLTEDAKLFEEAFFRTLRWQPLTSKAVDVITLTSPEPHAARDAFYGDALTRAWARRTESVSGNQGRFFVYNADQMWERLTSGAMPARLAKLGIRFEDRVGKERRPLKTILGEITDLEGGVEILTSPDPESAAIYTYQRMYGMREEMQRAGVIATPYGNFPEYSPDYKKRYSYRIC